MTNARPHSLQAGFTLVELMVSIAVLAIILVAAAQILSTTGKLTAVNNKHMDANDQARVVFDRMADDFARMVRRKDVDYLFWKNTATTGTLNDAMYFYTEGASYFDTSTFNVPSGATYNSEKNSVSLVGYRVNNNGGTYPSPASSDPDYYQLERLGKALSWDGGAYNASQSANNSVQPNVVAFLTYPPAGTDVFGGTYSGIAYSADPTGVKYSAAYFTSTLAGAYSNNANDAWGSLPSAVGTKTGAFNDSTDTSYRTLGSQVFRFEYCFLLKDGTYSDKPIMVAATAADPNGVPSSSVTGTTTRPYYTSGLKYPLDSSQALTTAANGGSTSVAVGSRYWDATDHIGYICVDPSLKAAVWREIGIQDVSAIIVTIAVIDKQGLTFVNANGGDLSKIAAKLLDYSPTVKWPATSTVTGNPAYLLDPIDTTAPVSWAYALLPTASGTTGVSSAKIVGSTILPKPLISQIRLYQRYFYLNSY